VNAIRRIFVTTVIAYGVIGTGPEINASIGIRVTTVTG
jgi:hypothetical protein